MGRRSANEGGICKRRQDRLWVAQYLVDTPEGKTKRKYIFRRRTSAPYVSRRLHHLDTHK